MNYPHCLVLGRKINLLLTGTSSWQTKTGTSHFLPAGEMSGEIDNIDTFVLNVSRELTPHESNLSDSVQEGLRTVFILPLFINLKHNYLRLFFFIYFCVST